MCCSFWKDSHVMFITGKLMFTQKIHIFSSNFLSSKKTRQLLTVVVDLEQLLFPLKRMNFNLYKVWWWWEDRLGSGGQQWAGHSLLILWLHFVGLVLDHSLSTVGELLYLSGTWFIKFQNLHSFIPCSLSLSPKTHCELEEVSKSKSKLKIVIEKKRGLIRQNQSVCRGRKHLLHFGGVK